MGIVAHILMLVNKGKEGTGIELTSNLALVARLD